MQWVGEERVLDVGGDELLVLLLVLETEGDAGERRAVGGILGRCLEQSGDGGVDVGAVGEVNPGRERRAGEAGAESFFSGISPSEL